VTEEHRTDERRGLSAGTSLLYGVPLTVFPFIAYFVLAATNWVTDWARTVIAVTLPSGGVLNLGFGDLLVFFGLVMLLLEVVKSTRAGAGSFLDMAASTIILIVALIAFFAVPWAATAPFLILILITLFDVISSISAARRRALQRAVSALT
jgi:hypothetical protein